MATNIDSPADLPHHLLIAGTGRAGTSFLVRLLHDVGMDTHLNRTGGDKDWDEQAGAGFEDILGSGHTSMPYVVKSPWLFQWVNRLDSSRFHIDGAILPIRDLADAAASRTIIEYQHMHQRLHALADDSDTWDSSWSAAGGAVFSTHPIDQQRLLAVGFFEVIQKLTEAEIPIHLVAFPRMVRDADYLYRAIKGVLPAGVTEQSFRASHSRIADPARVRVDAHIIETPAQAENAALKRELKTLRDQVQDLQSRVGSRQNEANPLPSSRPASLHERILARLRRL